MKTAFLTLLAAACTSEGIRTTNNVYTAVGEREGEWREKESQALSSGCYKWGGGISCARQEQTLAALHVELLTSESKCGEFKYIKSYFVNKNQPISGQ